MTEPIIDRLFPNEGVEQDHLAGLPDCTNGRATTFFEGLSDEDRELTQWYLLQGINPMNIQEYLVDLATGYASVDLERAYADGLQAAHDEVARARKFIDIFFASQKFFPIVRIFSEGVYEDGVRTGSVDFEGWLNMGDNFGLFSIENIRGYLSENVAPVPGLVDQFLDDPSSVLELAMPTALDS